MQKTVKQFLASSLIVVIFLFYIAYNRLGVFGSISSVPLVAAPILKSTQIGGVGHLYKDGVYTGDVVDAYYGRVQVQVMITDGKIVDVPFVEFPHDRRASQLVNQRAMPVLTAEAIQVQYSTVDVVSGATLTSQAFKKSLQSAINQAQM